VEILKLKVALLCMMLILLVSIVNATLRIVIEEPAYRDGNWVDNHTFTANLDSPWDTSKAIRLSVAEFLGEKGSDIQWNGLKVENAFRTNVTDMLYYGNVEIMVIRPIEKSTENYTSEDVLTAAASSYMNRYHRKITDEKIIDYNGGTSNACLLDAGNTSEAIAFKQGNDIIVIGVLAAQNLGMSPAEVINHITVT
jgi:hypothetical protein